MSLKTAIEGSFVKKFISGIANKDHGTTLLGFVAGSLVVANIDFNKLLQGDHTELSKAVGTLVLAAFGYLTNKDSSEPKEDGK